MLALESLPPNYLVTSSCIIEKKTYHQTSPIHVHLDCQLQVMIWGQLDTTPRMLSALTTVSDLQQLRVLYDFRKLYCGLASSSGCRRGSRRRCDSTDRRGHYAVGTTGRPIVDMGGRRSTSGPLNRGCGPNGRDRIWRRKRLVVVAIASRGFLAYGPGPCR